MTSVSVKLKRAVAGLSMLGAGMAGCGDGLQDAPENAPYVAPPSPGEMKPPPKQKGVKPRVGVPLSSHPASVPVSDLPSQITA